VLAMMDAVFEEVEVAFLRIWPSKAGQLAERGIT
jgi:hypothetical protein